MYFLNQDSASAINTITKTNKESKMEQQKQEQQKRPERTQIMTPKEAAKYLGFHLVTIYRLLKKQEIPATKIGGQWRFKKDVLDAWLLDRMNNK
jgi:excisionase family DNA binding protein